MLLTEAQARPAELCYIALPCEGTTELLFRLTLTFSCALGRSSSSIRRLLLRCISLKMLYRTAISGDIESIAHTPSPIACTVRQRPPVIHLHTQQACDVSSLWLQQTRQCNAAHSYLQPTPACSTSTFSIFACSTSNTQ